MRFFFFLVLVQETWVDEISLQTNTPTALLPRRSPTRVTLLRNPVRYHQSSYALKS